MDTFSPTQFFLRVGDKFYPDFVDLDAELRAGPSFLYVQLFRRCRDHDRCTLPQADLAKICKCSVRSIQSHIRSLVQLKYLRVELNEDGPNTYVLLFSPRVKLFLTQAGVDLAPVRQSASSSFATSATVIFCDPPTQNLQGGGANFAYSLRDLRDQENSPLTPPCSEQDSSSSASERGSGGSSVRVRSAQTHPDAQIQAYFEKLWEAWSRKQDKLNAMRVFTSMARSGQLPPLAELLNVVERFKAEDRAWRNGCVPNLRFWLQGHRWHDELSPVNPGQAPAEAALPENSVAQAQVQAQVLAIQEKFSESMLNAKGKGDELSSAADALSPLWPDVPRGKILAQLIAAKARGFSLVDLAGTALNWRGTLPPTMADWFAQVAL